MGMTIDEAIIALERDIHNARICGYQIDQYKVAIDSMRKCQRIAKAIDKVEEYICDVETNTVKAQGMAQALDIIEQVLGGSEDGNDD